MYSQKIKTLKFLYSLLNILLVGICLTSLARAESTPEIASNFSFPLNRSIVTTGGLMGSATISINQKGD